MVATPEDVTVDSPRPGVAVVTFAGEHDLATSQSISDVLETLVAESELVVADFSGAQFVDSSILNVLVATEQISRENGTTFRIQLGTEAIVERAFEVSGILKAISWAPSREEALEASRPAARRTLGGSDEGPG